MFFKCKQSETYSDDENQEQGSEEFGQWGTKQFMLDSDLNSDTINPGNLFHHD